MTTETRISHEDAIRALQREYYEDVNGIVVDSRMVDYIVDAMESHGMTIERFEATPA